MIDSLHFFDSQRVIPTRLFFAACFPEQTLDRLHALTAQLRDTLGPARYTARENFHLTLRFLGERTPRETAALQTALRDEPGLSGASFLVASRGLSAFPSGGDFTLYLDLDPAPALLALEKSLGAALARWGEGASGKRFHPHITLARRVTRAQRDRLPAVPVLSLPIQKLVLFESVLSPAGPAYTPLEERALAQTPEPAF